MVQIQTQKPKDASCTTLVEDASPPQPSARVRQQKVRMPAEGVPAVITLMIVSVVLHLSVSLSPYVEWKDG